MKVLLKNANVLDSFNGSKNEVDILISGSKVRRIGINILDKNALIIDVRDKIAVPNLMDVHVHFRQPGQEHKETIYTGSLAAAAGGFTAVVAEPNTVPPIDTPTKILRDFVLKDLNQQNFLKCI